MSAADDNEAQVEAVPPGPGAQLRAAREAEGLSFDDVVHALRLESSIVAAIERDDLDGLSAPVFVKGYLRSYARLVDLPEQAVVDAWQPAEQDPEEFRTQSVQREIKTGASLSMFVLWCLLGVVVIAALLYLMLGGEDEQSEPPADVTEVTRPAVEAPQIRGDFVVAGEPPVVLPETAPVVAAPAPREAAMAAPEAPVAEAPALATEAEEPIADDTVPMQLFFTAECWVEVSADGRRLLYGLEKAGSERRFTVKPPLRFFVGNVDAVRITVAGAEYTIPRSVRTGRNTARFVLTAGGIEGLQ